VKLVIFLLLTWLTGSPLLAIAVLLVLYWSVDRVTFGFLPDPVRALRRLQRQGQLARVIADNPHDRRARFERAELLVGMRRFRAAVEVLRGNLEAGDDDPATLLLMGRACAGAGLHDPAARFLQAAQEREPDFAQNAIDLELGRARLLAGDPAGAAPPLRRFVAARTSTVEGRVLLARALDRTGDGPGARRARDEAWEEFAGAPRFQRRRERLWAWRARPSRPIVYALVAAAIGFALAQAALPAARRAVPASRRDDF
jgi:Flp pilus assembly protein TadD